jgi:hypothetical protein
MSTIGNRGSGRWPAEVVARRRRDELAAGRADELGLDEVVHVDRGVVGGRAGNGGDERVDLVEERMAVARVGADDREAVRAGGDDLRAGEPLLEAVEAVGVDGDVAVDERVLELVGGGLDLELGLCRLLIVDVPSS